jgi:uncharacterized membrane protein
VPVAPWAAVFIAGVVVSLLLAARRHSASEVRLLLSEVDNRHPPVATTDSGDTCRFRL